MDPILQRRSIRKYTDQPVPDSIVKELLECAMSAPSAGNQQPWHFVVVRDRDVLNEIPRLHPFSKMLREAQLAILVCADLDLETNRGYWVQDCSAATQNILIAVQDRGLGAVWLGIYPREERVAGMRNLLNLPPQVMPLSLVSIGYPAEKKPPADRYNPARVHYDRW